MLKSRGLENLLDLDYNRIAQPVFWRQSHEENHNGIMSTNARVIPYTRILTDTNTYIERYVHMYIRLHVCNLPVPVAKDIK